MKKHNLFLLLTQLTWLIAFHTLCITGCLTSAYRQSIAGGEILEPVDRIYTTDLNTAWQATLEALKNNQLDVSNREAGFIQTKWIDNTAEKNFAESFGVQDSFLKSQYRLQLNLTKGYYNGRPTIKVTVQKEQLIERDILEGWKPIGTDFIDETTLLYRIGQIIFIKMKMAQLEEKNSQEEIEKSGL